MQIHSVALLTTDLKIQREFYAECLGLSLVAETANTITFQIGNSFLCFQQEQNFDGFYHFAFDIPCNQIEDADTWLRQRVPLLATKGQSRFRMVERWNSSNMYFTDPAGNIAEFIARHDQRHIAHTAFSHESVLHISELGVVLPSVPKGAKWLKQQFNLEPFVGQSDTFTAVGSHTGMLILVQADRPWFPTQCKAKAAPFAIKFKHKRQWRQIQHTHFLDGMLPPSSIHPALSGVYS